jgi:outer membrane protein
MAEATTAKPKRRMANLESDAPPPYMTQNLQPEVVMIDVAPEPARMASPAVVQPRPDLPRPGTIGDLITEALRNNPRVQAAWAQLLAKRQNRPIARSALLPQISLLGTANHIQTRWHGGGRSSADPAGATLSLSQAIYNGPAIMALNQAGPLVSSFEQEWLATQQAVLMEMMEVGISLLQAIEVEELSKNNLEVTEKHLEATRTRFEVGVITQTDVSQAEARVASARSSWIQARNMVGVYQARFKEVTGDPPADKLILPVPTSLEALGIPRSEAERSTRILTLLDQRPDILAARFRVESALRGIETKQSQHHPTVALTSSAGRDWNNINNLPDPVDSYSVGFSVSVPLFTGGRISAETDQARRERDAAQADLDRLKRLAQREWDQALLDHESTTAQEQALGSAVKAAAAASAGVDEEFRVGTRTALDLLDAQLELFSNQTELAKIRYAVQLAQYRLLKAAGRLDLPTLGF